MHMLVFSRFARKWQAGFTLIELLVSLLLTSVTLAALISFFYFQSNALRIENARRAAQMTARGAMNFIVRQLDNVGRSPNQAFTAAAPAIQTAEEDNLHYLANLSTDWADTDTDDTWEDVTFQYDEGSQTVVFNNGADTYALTDDSVNPKSYVPAGGLVFMYFDDDGNAVAPGGGAAERASIRRINVALTVNGVVPEGHEEPTVTLSQDVYLRNVS
jgi:prepilin-type N-terminal cleavage/methylation domain-containing protein